jgi:hypothetical protein
MVGGSRDPYAVLKRKLSYVALSIVAPGEEFFAVLEVMDRLARLVFGVRLAGVLSGRVRT